MAPMSGLSETAPCHAVSLLVSRRRGEATVGEMGGARHHPVEGKDFR
jgi:hypothetical protein